VHQQERDHRRSADAGFSLVELIVAISIMGVLAAIAVPAFQGLQTGVRQQATVADLSSDRTALIAWGIDNNGAIPPQSGFDPGRSGLNLVGYGWSQSRDSVSYQYVQDSLRAAWCLEMANSTGVTFRVSSNRGTPVPGSCGTLGLGNF
jgi:prepilin-type N-terminal cleavage/methylation domain-containing protein